ncbi:MAG: hypothetical protein AB8C95_09865, partial [Phycisphaeraceae bacterium]
MLTTKHFVALIGATALTFGSQAAPLQIDFSADAGTQFGWAGLGGTGDGATKSGTFMGFTDLATGDIAVTDLTATTAKTASGAD